ncbi:MAG: hypothetical protein L0I76_08980 [Pseudonocardia sp.]|nr:hypothetical protein [Pseudonocardia sp.]
MPTPTTEPGSLTVLRAVITLQTLIIFAASVTAGLLLSVPGGSALHSATAYTLFVVAVVHVVAAFLAWRPGGGSARPVVYAGIFLAATLAQVGLGIAHLKVLHIPLGVTMFGASALELAWIWSSARAVHHRPATEPVATGAGPAGRE